MLRFNVILLAVLLAWAHAEDPKVEVEEGVLVLTTDNFDHVVNNNEFVLVEFYAPWCGHCKRLAPEYAQAAQALAEEGSPIKLAKVDATVEKDLGTKFGVRGYPTLKFFRDGSASEYNGGRAKDLIINWLKKKSGPPAVTVSSKEEAEKLMQKEVTIIGFFKDVESDDAKAFLKVAAQNDDFEFGICSDESLMKEYEIEKEGVALFKHFDEKKAQLTEDLTEANIKQFVNDKATPLFTEFTQAVSQKLFSDKSVPFLFLAMKKTAENFDKVKEAFTKIAEEVKGKLKVVFLDREGGQATQVLNYMDMKGDDADYRILNLDKGLKYKPDLVDLAEEKVQEFVKGFVDGTVKPFLKSEEVPDDWDKANVKVLVGKNFKEVAIDSGKHVFVEFYAPWCGHCKNLAPVWEELAEKFAKNDDVIIAKMDSTQNEVEEVSIKGFPTLRMFTGGKILEYDGGRKLEELVQYVSKYSKPVSEEKEAEVPEEAVKEEKKEKKDEL